MRVCIHCKLQKPIADFDTHSAGGPRNVCKECRRAACRFYDALNPDVKQRNGRARVLRQYGLTVAQYDQMLDSQGGVCKLCGSPPKRNRLCVDHCHRTGNVRGLLCPFCNRMLGNWKDNPATFRRAATYLEGAL